MNIEQLPTKGRCYGSGEAITEFNALVDEVMEFAPSRCDCDSHTRCLGCIMTQEMTYRKETLKKKIADLIKNVEKSEKNV